MSSKSYIHKILIKLLILSISSIVTCTPQEVTSPEKYIDNRTSAEHSKAPISPACCALTAIYENQSTEKSRIQKKSELETKITYYKGKAPTPEEIALAKEPQLFTLHFSGYVKPEFFWDSRQTVGSRNDQVLIYPEPKELDRCGRDIQATPAFEMIAIESRVRADIIGPDVLGAHAKAAIEADFYGINERTCNVFRMRHAYTVLDWETTELLFGQYWHPMYIGECTPNTLAGNAGAPMDPYKRAPQIRFSKRVNPFEFTVAALSEIHFNNDGPLGPSCVYLRDAVIPDLSARCIAHHNSHIYGIAIDFKRLVPRLKTDFNIKVEESIYSAACSLFSTFTGESFILRLKTTVAQNAADLSLLGGYAVHSIQPESDKRTYASLQSLAVWADFNRANSNIEPGCFVGFAKNIGASKNIIPALKKDDELHHLTYGLSTELVDYVFRIQPRVRWFVKPVVFGFELEYTRASYGQPNIRGKNADRPSYLHPDGHSIAPGPTANTRVYFAAIYYF